MKLLKLALISAVVLFIIIWLFSLMIPSRVIISRAMDIHAPKEAVLPRLRDMRSWEQWNKMLNDGTVTNKKVTADHYQSDQLDIAFETAVGDTIRTRWKQKDGKEIASGYSWHEAQGTTVIQWYFAVQLKWYPWEKLGSIVLDKQLGPAMEQSLTALKKQIEK